MVFSQPSRLDARSQGEGYKADARCTDLDFDPESPYLSNLCREYEFEALAVDGGISDDLVGTCCHQGSAVPTDTNDLSRQVG